MKGITAVEIIIFIAVALILFSVVFGAFRAFRDNEEVLRTNEEIVSLVREARERTLASQGASQFGVYFEQTRVVLFQGGAFVDGAPSNKTFLLPLATELTAINVSGNAVVFERLTGNASAAGDVSIRIRGESATSSVIVITREGLIYNE